MTIVPLPPENHTVTKLLPSTNTTPTKSLVVSQDNIKGILAPIPYGQSPGANTLTPDGYITRQVVLQGNPMPLTPGLNSSTGPSGNYPNNHYSYLCNIKLRAQLHSTPYFKHYHMGRHLTGKAPCEILSITNRQRRVIPTTSTSVMRSIPTRIWAA